jgi:GntR family transcriptional regulator/MocR family aminotransferase
MKTTKPKRSPGLPPVIAIERTSAVPLYRQLYDRYREAIVERRLRPGERLPSTRTLAAELRISRMPVLNAFEQLLAEGYFEARVGAGTFVASSLPDVRPAAAGVGAPSQDSQPPERSARRAVSQRSGSVLRAAPEAWLQGWGAFRVSQPAVDRFPFQVWSALVARHSRNPRASRLNYGSALGDLPFREAVADYLRTSRAVRCDAGQIMVVSGSQQALEIAARVLLDPADRVWVEEPGYSGARDVLTLAGAQLVPVPVDGEGLDVAAGIARDPQAQAACVTPSHQYPLGATLSASRRLQLLAWAAREGAWIFEDDYDSEYRYESLPIASLQGLDRDARVIYIGTFSKVLFPALRIGYLVIPADLVARFAAVREAMDIFPPTLYQAVLADFLSEGHFARHLRRMRQLYRERRDALVATIRQELGDELPVLDGQAGLHLVAALPEGTDDLAVSLAAARQGLWAMPLSTCYAGEPLRRGLVLGYGGTDIAEIPGGVRRLRDVLRRAGRAPARTDGG